MPLSRYTDPGVQITENHPVLLRTEYAPVPSLYTISSTTDSTTVWRAWQEITLTTSGSTYFNGEPCTLYNLPTTLTTSGGTTSIRDVVWNTWSLDQTTNRWTATGRTRSVEVTPDVVRAENEARLTQAQQEAYQESITNAREAHQQSVTRERVEREQANLRAEELLRSVLNEVQRRTLDAQNHFFLRSSTGGVYRIDRGRAGNVRLIDEKTGKVLRKYCCHPREQVPDADTMLAQFLHLLTPEQEQAFLHLANKFETQHEKGHDPEELKQLLAS